MAAGEMTARAARRLEVLAGSKFDVLFDHGDKVQDAPDRLGRTVSWFGSAHTQESELAMVDIALVSPRTQEALLLVEVEESSDNPKTLLGDALGTLLGAHLTFQGRCDLQVGPATTLAILARVGKQAHGRRTAYLQRQLSLLRNSLATPNARIGHIVVDTFVDEGELGHKLSELAKAAIARDEVKP